VVTLSLVILDEVLVGRMTLQQFVTVAKSERSFEKSPTRQPFYGREIFGIEILNLVVK
jgi:hypothetical protein